MKCVYINLDSATARRRSVEAGFARLAPAGWELVRFPAVDAAVAAQTPGSISPSAKGCFCSHRAVLEQSLADEEPVFIVEDDVVFSPRCFRVVDAQIAAGAPWDLMFTDVLPTNAGLMLDLARRWTERAAANSFGLVDVSAGFASTTGYVVNGRSKAKLAERLAAFQNLDTPYDLALRQIVREGGLRAAVIFPFVTSIAEQAEDSQIQDDRGASADVVFNAYRRLLYIDRDLDACRRAAEALRRDYSDEHSRLAGDILGALVSPRFPRDR